MELIRKEGGYALFKSEDELHFVDYKSSGLNASIFVFGLIALITLLNVAIQMFMGNEGVLSVLFVIGLLCFFLWRKQKKKRQLLEVAPAKENTILIIDFLKSQVFTQDGKLLGSIEECRLAYEFQPISSAKKLVLYYPKGKVLVAKGNPFRGLNSPFKEILKNYNLFNL